MGKDILFIITRVCGEGEWDGDWQFETDKDIAFVSQQCMLEYEKVSNPGNVSLVVVKGNTKIAPTILKLITDNFHDRKVWLLIHPGGEQLTGILSDLRQPVEDDNNKVQYWESLLKNSCTYSIGGGSNEEKVLGKEIQSLAGFRKKGCKNKFGETLSNLFKAFSRCTGVKEIIKRTEKVASEIIRNKVPWRYEYFFDLSQRLLALNDENKAVVKKIIFGEGAQEGKSYEQRCTPNNERDVEVIVDNVKCKKNEHEVFRHIQNWVSELLKDENCKNKHLLDGGQDYTCLYSNIYNCLEALCRNEKEKILGKEKYSST